MFQDKHIQDSFNALNSDHQAEVADFIEFLHQKQSKAPFQNREHQLAKLLLGENVQEDPDMNRIWDEALNDLEGTKCSEPQLEER